MNVAHHDRTSCFRVPSDLASANPPVKALLIGQCLLDKWPNIVAEIAPTATIHRVDFNHFAKLPASPPVPADEYDFQIVSLPFRSILPEHEYMLLDCSTPDDAGRLFSRCKDRIELLLSEALAWNASSGLLSLVCNILVPQQNPLGRTLPRNDLRNLCFLVEEFNRHLTSLVESRKNVFVLDVDSVASSIGRRYIQDDVVHVFSHAGVIEDYNIAADRSRIAPPSQTITELYRTQINQFVQEVWMEACAIARTVLSVAPVKLVIMDLDDTLWRGVLAEETSFGAEVVEGWPLGVVDALTFLRKRGIILAIASKNDEANVVRVFDEFYKYRLPLDHFAIRKINWTSKMENVAEIIREANVGVDATVFVDDNPVERAAVETALPGIRTLGADPYSLKRVLLWSSETQVVRITEESVHRNETIAANLVRQTERAQITREDFLAGLGLRLVVAPLDREDTANVERSFELINKTNQFNTTGERWRRNQFDDAMGANGSSRFLTVHVNDSAINYGLVALIALQGNRIQQAVMSCRVFGMDIEHAILQEAVRAIFANGHEDVEGRMIHTDRNMPCRGWFSDNGFEHRQDHWILEKKDWAARHISHIDLATTA